MGCGINGADVRQNLEDAGCSEELIGKCIKALDAGAVRDCSRLLDIYRRTLLDGIHIQEEKLSRLDYLRHRLKKP